MTARRLSVRRARKGDVRRLCSLHRASIRVLCSRHYDSDQIQQWVTPKNPQDYEERIGRGEVLVAEEEEEIIGFSQFDSRRGELHGLYVDPLYVGSGVGSRLLAETERTARSRGLAAISVNATLNSTGFYKARGWVAKGDSTNPLPSGGELLCVRMGKSLATD